MRRKSQSALSAGTPCIVSRSCCDGPSRRDLDLPYTHIYCVELRKSYV
jgi:hypothetical protein